MQDRADRRHPTVVVASNSVTETTLDAPWRADAEFYRLLFNQHPTPVWVIDEATLRFDAVNDAVVHAFGYSRDELLTMTVRDVSPQEDGDRLLARSTEEVVGAAVVPWRHRTRSGAVLSIETTITPLTVAGRRVRLVVATDIADRHRAEGALREREAFLRSLISNIPCGVFWKDRASIYLGCNEQVAQDRGLSVAGEVVGRTDYELSSDPEEAEASRASDRMVIDSGKPLPNVEEVRTNPDCTRATLLTSRVPLRDGAGQVVGVLGVYQDVTDRKRLEDRLRQSQKMEAIGRLAGGIAHDFNNLLTIIFCNIQLIQEHPHAGVGIVPLIEDIHGAADRAAALTRQLLAFGRKQPSRPVVVDLNETVAGLASLLRRLIGEGIQVRSLLSPAALRLRVDRSQLEQVILNLAVNARDAMPHGGKLTISTTEVTATGGVPGDQTQYAQLTVSDTGIGMSNDVKARIFEPFFTTKEVGKGTGLGLATVHGIVDQAGGAIEVESTPGAGTTFRLRFPRCDSPLSTSVIATAGPRSSRAGRGQSALVVEDEDTIRRLARQVLEAEGYIVTEASRADDALSRLTPDQRFDLVVTDMIMPGMDGRELAVRLRAAQPDVGVVFISGYVPDSSRLDEVPDAYFLPKPFTPAELTHVAEMASRRTRMG